MVLVDTSVWVDHLRKGDKQLAELLERGGVLVHPFVIGELALGRLTHRRAILENLRDLPQAIVATDDEVLRSIEQRRFFETGIGYVDAHLLAAVLLTPGSSLWTRDQRLLRTASDLGVSRHRAESS